MLIAIIVCWSEYEHNKSIVKNKNDKKNKTGDVELCCIRIYVDLHTVQCTMAMR